MHFVVQIQVFVRDLGEDEPSLGGNREGAHELPRIEDAVNAAPLIVADLLHDFLLSHGRLSVVISVAAEIFDIRARSSDTCPADHVVKLRLFDLMETGVAGHFNELAGVAREDDVNVYRDQAL